MRVMVTGASGYVGSHTVAALLAHGHRPRALVRDPGKAMKQLAVLGVPATSVDFVPGDMLDERAVGEALDGCQAAIHAAAAIGVTGGTEDLVEINLTGTRNVVGAALALGLDPVIHVSSVGVFVPPPRAVITAEDPLSSPRTGYGRAKVAAEQYIRDLQDRGEPITTIYPGGVCGPNQPTLDNLMEGLAAALGKVWPLSGGGVTVLDVRDLGEALARAVAPGQGARRWMLGGHFLTWAQFADLCDELTDVKCRRCTVPDRLMLGFGSFLDTVKKIKDFDYPLTRDAAEYIVRMVPTDDSPVLEALEMSLRPVEATVTDSVRWLVDAGHLKPSKAGRLAPTSPEEN